MTGGFLGVISAHIRELSAGQTKANSAIGAAAKLTDGVSKSMWLSHGAVCAASNTAVGMAHSAREAASTAMAATSHDLSQKLGVAASRYDQTDAQAGGTLNQEMHPR